MSIRAIHDDRASVCCRVAREVAARRVERAVEHGDCASRCRQSVVVDEGRLVGGHLAAADNESAGSKGPAQHAVGHAKPPTCGVNQGGSLGALQCDGVQMDLDIAGDDDEWLG